MHDTRSRLLPHSKCRELPLRPISTYEAQAWERAQQERRNERMFYTGVAFAAALLLFSSLC